MEPLIKSLDHPDEELRLPGITEELVDLGDLTVGRVVHQPGWRWSVDVRPVVGGEWCQARHVGVVLAGRLGFVMESGAEYTVGPFDVYELPPGHDGYVIGDEPAVVLDWAGLRTIAGRHRAGATNRVVLTLLFTDLVDSTATADAVGDVVWRERLAHHLETCRDAVEQFGGTMVTTTGDGLLATFSAPTTALPCAAEIQRRSARDGLGVRAGVHVGEVDVVGTTVRGVAVHEAARVMAEAGAGEVFASELTRNLAAASGYAFADAGLHTLKGLEGERRLYSYLGVGQPAAR